MMIDVETLGVGTSAPIFQIAAVEFNHHPQQIYRKFLVDIDLLDCIMRTGFMPQEDTVKWWQQQKYSPQRPDKVVSLTEALHELTKFISEGTIDKVWANSPAFDLVLLERHYEAVGLVKPWTHKMEADFRTVRHVVHMFEADEPEAQEPTHNALDDCLGQINHLWGMLECLGSK